MPNPVQKVVFDLMKLSSFNNFDGESVVKLLEENEKLWTGAIWGRFDGYAELIPLRDIGENIYNADTLYILATKAGDAELELLVSKNFDADEVDYLSNSEASSKLGSYGSEARDNPDGKSRVLRVWWD